MSIVAQDGSTPPEQITTGGNAQRYSPTWSSDGKKIAFSDKDGKLWVLTLATKQLQMVVDALIGLVSSYEWSPKGNFIAYSMQPAA